MEYQKSEVSAEVTVSVLCTIFTTLCYWASTAILQGGADLLGKIFAILFGFYGICSWLIMLYGHVEALQLFVKTESRRTEYRRWSMKLPNLALTGSVTFWILTSERPVLRFMFAVFTVHSFLIVVYGYAARFVMEHTRDKLTSVK